MSRRDEGPETAFGAAAHIAGWLVLLAIGLAAFARAMS